MWILSKCQHLKKDIYIFNKCNSKKLNLFWSSVAQIHCIDTIYGREGDDFDLSCLIASKRHEDNLERISPLYDLFHQWKNRSENKPRRPFVCDSERNDRDIQSCHYEPKPTRRRRTIFLHCQELEYIRRIVHEHCLSWYFIQACVMLIWISTTNSCKVYIVYWILHVYNNS